MTTSQNNSYFETQGTPSAGECLLRVCPADDNICQVGSKTTVPAGMIFDSTDCAHKKAIYLGKQNNAAHVTLFTSKISSMTLSSFGATIYVKFFISI